jgi:hypothetical protein
MVLSEAKLRYVIREELQQYLIEQGFLQRVGSGIKSAYQNLIGGKKQQSSQQPTTNTSQASQLPRVSQETSLNSKLDKIISRQNSRTYGVLINQKQDISKAIADYQQLLKTDGGKQALIQILSNLTANLNHRQTAGYPTVANYNVLEIYKTFIGDIKNNLKKQNLNENEIEEKRKKVRTVIPDDVFMLYIDEIEDFIYDNNLLKLMNDNNVKNYFDTLENSLKSQQSAAAEESKAKNVPGSLAGFPRGGSMSKEEIAAQEELEAARSRQSAQTTRHNAEFGDAETFLKNNYYLIRNEGDIQKAINDYYHRPFSNSLNGILIHIYNSILRYPGILPVQQQRIYKTFIDDLDKVIKQQNVKNKKVNEQVEPNYDKLPEINKNFVIPDNILAKTILAFSDFIFEPQQIKNDNRRNDFIDGRSQLISYFNNSNIAGLFNAIKKEYNNKSQESPEDQKIKAQEKTEQDFFAKGSLYERMKKLKRVK